MTLNPVAGLIELATVKWPLEHGPRLRICVQHRGQHLISEARSRLAGTFPDEPQADAQPDGYLWARTVTCPYCDGLDPLSPNWRLAPGGAGVRLRLRCSEGPGSPGRVQEHQKHPGNDHGSLLCQRPVHAHFRIGKDCRRTSTGWPDG